MKLRKSFPLAVAKTPAKPARHVVVTHQLTGFGSVDVDWKMLSLKEFVIEDEHLGAPKHYHAIIKL